MIASLPMYDTSATRGANDRLWALIRDNLGYGPRALDREFDLDAMWHHPGLVLSQTCGLPYRRDLHGHVTLVGTPDYAVPGCPPGHYRSHLVVRAEDARCDLSGFHDARLARNSASSQSGWAAIDGHLKEQALGFSFQGRTLDTGSHGASVLAVREGQADIAALDAMTWTLLERDTSDTDGLRILLSTRPTPGLPLITAKGRDPHALSDAVRHAIDALTVQDKALLRLKQLVTIPSADYLVEPLPSA